MALTMRDKNAVQSDLSEWPAEVKVHDLENLGGREMIFNTIEFLDSPNKPLPIPDKLRLAAR